jgi:predicted MFS family arabinose efflux permease
MGDSQPKMFDALTVPRYGFLLAAGWFWSIARWVAGFIGAFVVNNETGSARLVQLTGVSMWAPLLLGGLVGGVISDRFDRRLTVIVQFVMVAPLAVGLGLAGMTDRLELWMVYPFLVVVGIGWVVDMTSRRAIVYDMVGATRIDNAMALESVVSASGLAIGALVGGTVIEALGVGQAFVAVAGLLGLALLCILAVPEVEKHSVSGGSGLEAFVAGVKMLRSERALVSVLGVTVLVNFFFFSLIPLVQVIGTDLDAGPALLGLLAAMIGFGMMGGSLVLARFQPSRRGVFYVCGSFIALFFAIPFATASVYWLAAGSIFIAAFGLGFFGSTQGLIVMTAVDKARRGRALGLLSTAIGVLPIGMIALGELAEVIGASPAVVASATTGALGLAIWLRYWPESWRVAADGGEQVSRR